jgi:hypothetical protein
MLNMAFRSSPRFTQAIRYASTAASTTGRQNLAGTATAVTYCCAVASAPFAGAYVISQNAVQDKRYANLYVSFLETPISTHSPY